MGLNAGAESILLPLVVLWPLVAAMIAGALALAGFRRAGFDHFVSAAAGVSLVGVIALVPPVLAASRVTASLPAWLGRAEFAADPISLVFALAAALVWFAATLYAATWLRDDPARARYQVSSLVLLAANLGVVLAGDLVTLYVSFEILGLLALLLVVHDGTETARRAGVKYFWMTLAGGISLLAGMMLLATAADSTLLQPVPPQAGSPALLWSAFALLLIGFGVKAGMVPLHVWLPDAHPVAPPPASALLSGVMIKTGAYGIFRCLNVVFLDDSSLESGARWHLSAPMGEIVMWFGLATMLIGVVLALGQHQIKRMLAWHSVSQMGFVLTGLGAGAWLGSQGAMATAGGLLHVVNHGLFKGCLFLGAGAVARQAGSTDMAELGGLWRRMPITFSCMLIAAAGITGAPLFNGFVSKCMIHHGLVEAAKAEGWQWMLPEWIFLATCAGTFASFVKLIGLVFVRKPQTPWKDSVGEAPGGMLAGMIVLSVPILVIGLRPQSILEGLIGPGLSALHIPAEPVSHYLGHYFLSIADFRSFAGMALAGTALFYFGMRFGLFGLHAPRWVGVDYWYCRAGSRFIVLCYLLSSRKTLYERLRFRDMLRQERLHLIAAQPAFFFRRFRGVRFRWQALCRDRLIPALQSAFGAIGNAGRDLQPALGWVILVLGLLLLVLALA